VTISPELEAQIRRLHFAEHWPVGTIAAQLDVHHDVVRRVIGAELRAEAAAQKKRPRATDPYLAFIVEQLKQHSTLRSTRIFDMLKERGYLGSERRLREVIAEVRPPRPREVYAHLDLIAGEQSQIDWAHLGRLRVRGALRELWLVVLTLSWSRAFWAELVLDLGGASLRRSLVRAARFFGGVTRQWLFDNPKTVVIGRDGGNVRFNPELLELAAHYHVEPRVCAPRKANQKGRVERTIRYLRERHFAGRSIATIEDGNRQLLRFIDEIAGARAHPDQPDRTVRDLLADEKSRLLPLPQHEPSTDQVLILPIDKYGFVTFDRNRYASPLSGRGTITLVAGENEVRLKDGLLEVARYARSYGRRERIGRVVQLPQRKPSAADHSLRAQLRQVVPAIDELFARWLDLGLNIGNVTFRAGRIAQLYGQAIFREAVEEMVKQGLVDLGALEVICDRLRRQRQQRMPVQLNLGAHVPDREVELVSLEVFDER
jgi:transposase